MGGGDSFRYSSRLFFLFFYGRYLYVFFPILKQLKNVIENVIFCKERNRKNVIYWGVSVKGKPNPEEQIKIFSLIHTGGLTQKQIALSVGISPINLNQKIKAYEKKGFLIRKNNTYFLTEKAITFFPRHIGENVIKERNVQTVRKHNVRVRVPLREPLREKPQVFLLSLGVEFNRMGLRNVYAGSFSLDNYVVELMPQACIVIMPDVEVPLSTSVEELAAQTWESLGAVLDKLERKLGIKFRRPSKDFFVGEISSRHIAFTNNELAASVKGEVKGLWVIEYSEEDGKPKLLIDFSVSPELEAVHTKEALVDVDLIKKNLGKEIKSMKSGEFAERRGAHEGLSVALALSEKARLKRDKEIRDNKRSYSIGLMAYCRKHEGEKPREELTQEFNEAVRPYFFC